MAQTSLHKLYVTMAKKGIPPAFFYVVANPIHYTEKVRHPSAIS